MLQIPSRMRLKRYCFLKLHFHLIFQGFFAKNLSKFKVGIIRSYVEQTVYFGQKTASSFLKAPLTKLDGAKYPRGNQVPRYTSVRDFGIPSSNF